jgi:hemolysin activation/secretion protein
MCTSWAVPARAADEPAPEPRVEVRRVVVEGSSLLPEDDLRLLVEPWEGRTLSAAELGELAGAVQRRYAALGYVTTRVVVPPQEIADGTLRLRVVEGKVGAINVEGAEHFSPEHNYLPYLPAEGALLNVHLLRRGLQDLNRHPDKTASVVLQPGAEAGTSDVVLRVKEDHPYHVALSYDNAGTAGWHRARAYVTLQYDNLFDRSQVAMFQYGTYPWNTDEMRQYAASYFIPLAPLGGPVGHSITAYAGYSDAPSQTALGVFSLSGTGIVVGAGYSLPLPDLCSWRQNLTLGAEYQRVEDEVGFGGSSDVNVTHTLPLSATWHASRRHLDGTTDLSAGLHWQKDELYYDFDRSNYRTARTDAGTDFLICRLGARRVQNLGRQWTGSLALQSQLTGDRLLPAQQYGLGGYDTVRGYLRRVVASDEAISARMEVRTPALSDLSGGALGEQVQFLTFLDYGRAQNNDPEPGELDSEDLIGIGVGARASFFEQAVTARADLGWALNDIDSTPHNESGDCVAHFGVELRY